TADHHAARQTPRRRAPDNRTYTADPCAAQPARSATASGWHKLPASAPPGHGEADATLRLAVASGRSPAPARGDAHRAPAAAAQNRGPARRRTQLLRSSLAFVAV